MNLSDLKNKKVVVFGLGMEGFSTAKFLSGNNIEFSVAERKELELLPHDVQEFIKCGSVHLMSGETHAKNLKDFDIVVRNPGIPLWNSEIQEAIKNGSEVTSHIKLFFDLCPCPIIGVTGTKGKGTTATLIYEMLKASGRDTYLGGNIGRPPLDFIDKLTKDSVVVLELSSFQLEDLNKSPHVAVVLMVTQEHLNSQSIESPNYHRSLTEYLEAKKNMVRFQSSNDYCITNSDYEQSRSFAEVTKGHIVYFSVTRALTEGGAYLDGKRLVVKTKGPVVEICTKDEVLLRGDHNVQNILAASQAALLCGANPESVANTVRNFRGLEHRLEFVRDVFGVKYYNDSFSSTPEPAMAAIKSFSEPEILILGGSDKGSDYTDLGKSIASAKNIKNIILVGVTAPKIKEAIIAAGGDAGKLIEGASSMKDIVMLASEISRPGNVVILSPACASFDMFRNYKDRGRQFKEIVLSL